MNHARGTVAILGAFLADTALRLRHWPEAGETLPCLARQSGPGGKGSNQAIGAARLGADVSLITRIGADEAGQMARAAWAGSGVRADHVIVDSDRPTGAAFILIDDDSAENRIVIDAGAALGLCVADVQSAAEAIRQASVFVTQLEQPLDVAAEGLAIARQSGTTAILNPAPFQDLPPAILGLCDIITPNQTEAALLAGRTVHSLDDAAQACERLLQLGAGAAVITMGAQGAVYASPPRVLHVPPLGGVTPVDTTGAGDAFTAGLATGLAEGLPIERALALGSVAAGLSIGRRGAAASMPSRQECNAAMGSLEVKEYDTLLHTR